MFMKKKMVLILLVLMTAVSFVAMRQNVIYANTSSSVTVIVDGRELNFPDAPAYIDENGRTQLPARFIGEALGAHVAWDSALEEVSVTRMSSLWDETNHTMTEIVFVLAVPTIG
jgi:hypothetical protein